MKQGRRARHARRPRRLPGPQARRRCGARYRGYDVLAMPPISSGGTALLEMLNVLEGYDLKAKGFGSADTVHLMAETMRRAFADRARHLGDPEANPDMPIARLISKDYAAHAAGHDRREEGLAPRRRRASNGPRRATRRRTCR